MHDFMTVCIDCLGNTGSGSYAGIPTYTAPLYNTKKITFINFTTKHIRKGFSKSIG